MARQPSFVKKQLERNKVKRDIIQNKLKGESYMYMGDPSLNWGLGGWARGHMNLIFGPSKSGKSTQAMLAAGQEQQKTGGWVVVLDSEWGYGDPQAQDDKGNYTERALKTRKRFTQAGLDPDKVLVIQSNIAGGEDGLFNVINEIEEDLAKDPNFVCSIIVDSWGGIQSEDARKKLKKNKADDAGKNFGGNAKTINPIIQELLRMCATYGVTVYSIQHVMVNMDEYGPDYLLPGGQKLMHLHDMILFIEGYETKNRAVLEGGVLGKSTDDTALRVGKQVKFIGYKSRNTVEGKTGVFYFDFVNMEFAVPEKSLFDLAVRLGVIIHPVNPETGKPNNSWWQFPAESANPMKWHGEPKTLTAISSDKDLYNRLNEACMSSKRVQSVEGGSSVSIDGQSVEDVISAGKGSEAS